jgi:hypothetical protein
VRRRAAELGLLINVARGCRVARPEQRRKPSSSAHELPETMALPIRAAGTLGIRAAIG